MTSASAFDEHAVQTGVVLIPLNKLKKSPDNARKTPHAKADIEALAASIHAKGVLQNLVVSPERTEAGAPTGCYFVTIGEGRRQAQLLRLKRKQIDANEPVRCVIDTANAAAEISLDENVTRSAMPVMDEVEAFAGLVERGMSVEDIARRFGCTLRLVEQRLALGRLSPKIRAAYRKGDINLDAARAFAINDDHAAQERVLRQLAKPITHAQSVRAALTAERVPGHDRIGRFVGVGVYEAAGGRMVRDLFEEDVVFFDDGALLQRLASDKLDLMLEALKQEGWAWTEALRGHGQVEGCSAERLHPTQRRMKPAEKKAIAELEAKLAALDEKLEDAAGDDALWAERDEIDVKLDALRDASRSYDPKQMAHSGAVIAIDRDGRAIITRGLIKRADLKAVAKLRREKGKPNADRADADEDNNNNNNNNDEDHSDGQRFTKALTEQLTQARTRALRASLAGNPHVALALVAYVFLRGSAANQDVAGVGLKTRPVGFDDNDTLERTRTTFAARFEVDETDLLAACLDQKPEKLLELMAVFLSETLDFSHAGATHQDRRLQRLGDCLARALDLDMTRHWEADQHFWQTAPKAVAIAALQTAPSIAAMGEEQRAGMLAAFAKMKKGELALTAAETLKGLGWLPDLLATPTSEDAFAVTEADQNVLSQTVAEAA